jgi:plastocyanin
MNATLFYALGISLVVAALAVSAIGLKYESFPQSRGIMLGVIGIFVVLVGGTATFALLNARDEQHKTEAEQAAQAAESSAATSTAGSTTTGTETSSTAAAKGPGGTVKISADPTGQLAFQQKSVTSKPGAVKIDFTNQAPVGHDVRIADASGQDLGGTNIVTGGNASATVNLAPGTYTFFCNVPGHEQAGMKGTLTVK